MARSWKVYETKNLNKYTQTFETCNRNFLGNVEEQWQNFKGCMLKVVQNHISKKENIA